jgi:hypothetical protein
MQVLRHHPCCIFDVVLIAFRMLHGSGDHAGEARGIFKYVR